MLARFVSIRVTTGVARSHNDLKTPTWPRWPSTLGIILVAVGVGPLSAIQWKLQSLEGVNVSSEQVTLWLAGAQTFAAIVLVGVTIWYASSAKKQAEQAKEQVIASRDQTKRIESAIKIANDQVRATREQTAQLQDQGDKLGQQIELMKQQIDQGRDQFLETQQFAMRPMLLISGSEIVHASKTAGHQQDVSSTLVRVQNVGQGPALNLWWKIKIGPFKVLLVDDEQGLRTALAPGGWCPVVHYGEPNGVTKVERCPTIMLYAEDLQQRRYEFIWVCSESGWLYQSPRSIAPA